MDVSVRSAMKGAAKCDKHRELQNSVNRQGLERILCSRDIPECMPASVSMLCIPAQCARASFACAASFWTSGCASGILEAFNCVALQGWPTMYTLGAMVAVFCKPLCNTPVA
jgi:hypothetical protein